MSRWEEVRAERPEETLVVSVVTWYEAIRGRAEGILKAEDEGKLKIAQARFRTTLEFLNRFEVISIDDPAASHFEKLRKQKKLKIGRADLLIACVALAHEALLVTRNTKDVKGVPGLCIEEWVS